MVTRHVVTVTAFGVGFRSVFLLVTRPGATVRAFRVGFRSVFCW
jgi:hypothetical protein